MNRKELKELCVNELNNLDKRDYEVAHTTADEILLKYLDKVAPEISQAWRAAADKIGFYCA